LPRLFVRQPLGAEASVALDPGQANYLGNVMRRGEGDEVLLFDGANGEWLARVTEVGRKRMILSAERQTRSQERVPDCVLAFAPVKRAQTDWLVEKATELGAAALHPVITQRTSVDRVKLDRHESIAIEAAEQCNRTTVPAIGEPIGLERWLAGRDTGRHLYFADESGGVPAGTAFKTGPAAILTGPEGGFSDAERALVRSSGNVTPISLGPRILRAETAALAALALFMATAGDWR
jgi:16S rRNA (uracil1498-N3)-methyltransferase